MNISFIKMDLEGSDMESLKGAKTTIISNKPTLAISIDHKPSHLVEIFKYLYELNPNFYFRIHNKVGTDAVLYAVG